MTGVPLQPVDGRAPRCPVCGFDLSGLLSQSVAVRCPECGDAVRLELAYSTQRERVTEWLRAPAEPTAARMLLTTTIALAAASVALLVVVTLVYIGWVVAARAIGP